MWATSTGLACGPASSRAGSPGTTRERKNVTSVMPHRTNTMNARRLAMSMPTARLLRYPALADYAEPRDSA
jgi:hypothetical protein